MKKWKKESDYQAYLKDLIKKLLPGCIVSKEDPNDIQGIPDLIVLFGKKWATLEVKKSLEDRKKPRPNQEYYVDRMNEMSFSRFIYPENEKEVLDELCETLRSGR